MQLIYPDTLALRSSRLGARKFGAVGADSELATARGPLGSSQVLSENWSKGLAVLPLAGPTGLPDCSLQPIRRRGGRKAADRYWSDFSDPRQLADALSSLDKGPYPHHHRSNELAVLVLQHSALHSGERGLPASALKPGA
jgi:hypothetical protein